MKVAAEEFDRYKRQRELFQSFYDRMEASGGPAVALMQKQSACLIRSYPEHLMVCFGRRCHADDLSLEKIAYLFKIGALFLRVTKLNGAAQPGLHLDDEAAFLKGLAFDRLLRRFLFFRPAARQIAAAGCLHDSNVTSSVAQDGICARATHIIATRRALDPPGDLTGFKLYPADRAIALLWGLRKQAILDARRDRTAPRNDAAAAAAR